ncbi:unnamed protein product [Allacma fusca]|uniref:G-protein coupled receptors family 1 profile domain-containing protein n=1 Tax=Allacma fusca TaxID=39272 RepID=A0A8J2LK71_9HEXA|nr:unnamed protein product [Allacma fusca]
MFLFCLFTWGAPPGKQRLDLDIKIKQNSNQHECSLLNKTTTGNWDSVVIKIIPCIALTVVSFRLINALIEAKRRKALLVSKRVTVNAKGHPENNNDSSSDRTTKMLLAVLVLFLITEFPQGIMALLSVLLGEQFFKECYVPLGDLMDFIALLNSAINFILYCVMSKKFRETFSQIFYIERLRARITSDFTSSSKEGDSKTISTTV